MTRRRWLIGGAIVLLVAVLGLLGAYARPSSAPDASCAARLIFQGRLYEAIGIARGSFTFAEQLGEATQPACFDSIREDGSGNVTLEGSDDQSVRINAVDGFDPRVAIARRDDPSAIYVAVGRCARYVGGEFWACLRRNESPVSCVPSAFVYATSSLVTTHYLCTSEDGVQVADVQVQQPFGRTTFKGTFPPWLRKRVGSNALSRYPWASARGFSPPEA
jgi:hypothetical protein